jgi:hypothetical protein
LIFQKGGGAAAWTETERPQGGSFRAINDATNPDINSTDQPQIRKPRLTLGAVLGDVAQLNYSLSLSHEMINLTLPLPIFWECVRCKYEGYEHSIYFIRNPGSIR